MTEKLLNNAVLNKTTKDKAVAYNFPLNPFSFPSPYFLKAQICTPLVKAFCFLPKRPSKFRKMLTSSSQLTKTFVAIVANHEPILMFV